MAEETLAILERGSFALPDGREVSLSQSLLEAVEGSRLYRPEDFSALYRERDRRLSGLVPGERLFEVKNETVLSGADRLRKEGRSVFCLNFASAKNPGGGFLGGSEAQEESLARSSGLYACQQRHFEMYETNRGFSSAFYTDHMIYSPGVPVFRDEEGSLLEEPYTISILTAPAVNAGAVRRNEPENATKINASMADRAEKVLSVALVQGHDTLLLGAWGCGVFQNDPGDVARIFGELLLPGGIFQHAFRRVHFSVLDRQKGEPVLLPFKKLFT
jgi:uncharacterized protein (TIGR02452 family)